jgi:hypothetical protein
MKVAVIGSGPSGWAAIQKLNQLGVDATLIDASLNENDQLRPLRRQESALISKKLYFGSDLPYRDFPVGPEIHKLGVNPVTSFATGGLSLVWGATMLPYPAEEIKKWPIEFGNLDKYFSEIAELIPICGEVDSLSDTYSNFISRNGIRISERLNEFYSRSKQFSQSGICVGKSRLAVETGKKSGGGCVYCSLCLSGCPDGFIWSSRFQFIDTKKIELRVIELSEKDKKVHIKGIDRHGASISINDFDKVFLGAGAIESFRIASSSGLVKKTAKLMDSATFFLPIFVRPKLGPAKNIGFSLAQIFIRLTPPGNLDAVQFQIYEHSEDFSSRARLILPFGKIIPLKFLDFVLKRFVVAIGYLSGDESPSISMKLEMDGSVVLTNDLDGLSKKKLAANRKASISRLGRFTRWLGLYPIGFLTQQALPGEGVHFGSWLAMGSDSDRLGRPNGVSNIHIIDSSVLPTIVAGPITFTVMANSMRIVEEALK